MKYLRLTVPSQITYTLNVLSRRAGAVFPDRQVIDVPLYDNDQIAAARRLEQEFLSCDVRGELRNSPNAVDVYAAEVIER
jgi:hypothetical protein